ncbi:Holliday junction ATP-dependent DNA helicase RuvA [Aeromicrobium sp. UC242_57]|uniref:Holliday junction ATP-dependent DNA helicase RuvA n=1 Tax=Aeromicrobium sp. UC242_57 TaxID=3374624 RepID=UPI00378B1EA2
MLAVLDPDRLRQAIGQSDLATLTTVPGIGRKGAERIVLELKDRVGVTTQSASTSVAWRGQVHEALLGLGWSAREADAALDHVAASLPAGSTPDVSQVLRDALRAMAKDR